MANDQMIPPGQKVCDSLAHFHGLQAEITDGLRQWSVYARCLVYCLITGDLGVGDYTWCVDQPCPSRVAVSGRGQ